MKKLVFGLFFGFCLLTSVYGQVKIGENPQNLHNNSVLELESTSKAFVITRMNTTQMNAMTPLNGALIYNTDTTCVHYFDGSIWINLCEAENAGDIGLVNNGDNTYTFTNADGAETIFETPAFTANHTGPFGANYPSGIKVTDNGNIVNIEVEGIHGNSLRNISVGRNKIALAAIGRDQLGQTSVYTDAIIEYAVTPSKLATGAANEILKTNGLGTNVEWGLIDASSITGQDLTVADASIVLTGITPGVGALLEAVGIAVADGGITTSKLANDAVTTDKILDATILNADVADNAINSSKIENETILSEDIVDGTIVTADVADDAITKDKINIDIAGTGLIQAGDGSLEVDGTAFDGDGNITSTHLNVGGDSNALLGDVTIEINANAVGTTEIADDAVTTDKILDATILNADVADNAINSIKIENETILSEDIFDGTIATADVADGAITNVKLDKTNIPLSGFADAATDVSLGSNKLINVVDPTDAQDAATKIYVDTEIAASEQIIVSTDTNNDITAGVDNGAYYDDATLQTNIANNVTAITTVQSDVDQNEADADAAITLKEDAANKSTDVTLADATNVKFPTELAVKTYVDTEITASEQTIVSTDADNDITAGVDNGAYYDDAALQSNIANNVTAITTVQSDVDQNEADADAAIALKEDAANKSIDVTLADATNVKFPTELAVKTYVDTEIAASEQTIVSTDADNDITAGADGGAYYDDAAAKTAIAAKENTANKSTDGTLAGNSDTDFPTEKAVKTYVDTNLAAETTRATTAETANATDITTLQTNKENTANKSTDNTLGGATPSDDLFPSEQAVKTYVDTNLATETARATAAENANATNIATNATNIAANTTDIATNTVGITALNTLTSGAIYIGDAGGSAAERIMTGDATIDDLGELTISNAVITPIKIEPSATNGQVLTTVGGNTVWQAPKVVAMGKINIDGGTNTVNENGATTIRNSIGNYTVTLGTTIATADYIIQLTLQGATFDSHIEVTLQSDVSFTVQITDSAGTPKDAQWFFTVTDF